MMSIKNKQTIFIGQQFGIVGAYNCGESCINPADYDTYKKFEPSMLPSNSSNPCSEFGFTYFLKTETHSAGDIKAVVDLYTTEKAAKSGYQSSATSCDGFTTEKQCMQQLTDAGEKCSWCSSSAVKSACYTESDAQSLPTSIFAC